MVGVSWYEADSFCRWITISRNDGYTYHLATEEEWERAARGPDGWKWPWGNIFERNRCNLGAGTAPVGSFSGDESPYGVFDMAGNVQE